MTTSKHDRKGRKRAVEQMNQPSAVPISPTPKQGIKVIQPATTDAFAAMPPRETIPKRTEMVEKLLAWVNGFDAVSPSMTRHEYRGRVETYFADFQRMGKSKLPVGL